MSEVRYIAKKNGEGRGATWRVYDRFRGSYPYARPGIGSIAQDHKTEAEAQAEADRLTSIDGYMPVGKKRGELTGGAKAASKKSADTDTEDEGVDDASGEDESDDTEGDEDDDGDDPE